MAPASKTDDGLITVSFNQTKSIGHREKNILRSIETVSKMISHILILISGLCLQVWRIPQPGRKKQSQVTNP